MADTTTVVPPNATWGYLADLVTAARAAAGQIPLYQFTATTIRYIADKDNATRIFFTTDPTSPAEGYPRLAEEILEDSGFPGAGVSVRKWYVMGNGVAKLDVIMEY